LLQTSPTSQQSIIMCLTVSGH